MKNCALKLGVIFATIVPNFIFSQIARAEESPTTFWVDHDVLTWSQTRIKPDQGRSLTNSSFTSTPTDVTIGIFWKDYGVYVTPGLSGGNIGLSYYATKELEFGLLLGSESSKSENSVGTAKQTNETKKSSIGAWAEYYLPVTTTSTAEFQLTYLHGNDKETTETSGSPTVTGRDAKSNSFTLLVQYAYQIAPHFNMIPGIVYAANTTKDDKLDSTDKISAFGINIAHFRYVF